MHFYTRMQARQQHYFSILPFCWSIWSLCTCYFSFLYGIVKQENYILLSLIKTCTHGILWGGKTNTVATTTICYKNQTPLLNIKYNTWMRILHERYVHRLYDQRLSMNKPFRVHPKLIGVHRSPSESHRRLIGDSSMNLRLIRISLEWKISLNLRNCMVERDESTADHSDIHEVPKVPHESSWMKHKSQIHHLRKTKIYIKARLWMKGKLTFKQHSNVKMAVKP